MRWLTFGLHSAYDSRPVTITSNQQRQHTVVATDTSWATVPMCVPPGGFTDVRLVAPMRSQIPGDQATLSDSQGSRTGGVFVSEISESDDVGDRCTP